MHCSHQFLCYLLSRDNLNASAVLITSTYACSSNRRDVIFKLWLSIANLNADCTSSVPCSNIAPAKRGKEKKIPSIKWTMTVFSSYSTNNISIFDFNFMTMNDYFSIHFHHIKRWKYWKKVMPTSFVVLVRRVHNPLKFLFNILFMHWKILENRWSLFFKQIVVDIPVEIGCFFCRKIGPSFEKMIFSLSSIFILRHILQL